MEGVQPISLACPRCGQDLIWLPHYGQWFCTKDALLFPGAPPTPIGSVPAPSPYGGLPAGYGSWPIPVPQPTGPPRPRWFAIGSIGHFVAAAASIAFGVLLLIFFFSPSILMAGVAVPFGIAIGVGLLTYLGMWRNYGTLTGTVIFGYGLGAVAYFIAGTTLALLSTGPPYYLRLGGIVPMLTTYVVVGALFILEGCAFILTRHFMGNPVASISAGVLLIVGGSLIGTTLLAVFGGFFVLVPGLILAGIVGARAPIPSVAYRQRVGAS